MENNHKVLDKKQFLENIIQNFFRKIQFGQPEIDTLYSGYIGLIENQIKKDKKISSKTKEMKEILDRVYRLFSDEEFRRIAIENQLNYKQIYSLYSENILGDNKRKYDMSDMYREDYIMKEEGGIGKKLLLAPKEGQIYEYTDSQGHKVTIQEIGRLYMQRWNAVKSYITKYRIKREIEEGEYDENEIFSHISIFDMSDELYREAVLEELLNERNISLSNVGRYVGEITKAPIEMEEAKPGSEGMIASNYFYKINEQYALEYEPINISAAMLYEAYEKMQTKLQKSEKIIPITRKLKEKEEKREGKIDKGLEI